MPFEAHADVAILQVAHRGRPEAACKLCPFQEDSIGNSCYFIPPSGCISRCIRSPIQNQRRMRPSIRCSTGAASILDAWYGEECSKDYWYEYRYLLLNTRTEKLWCDWSACCTYHSYWHAYSYRSGGPERRIFPYSGRDVGCGDCPYCVSPIVSPIVSLLSSVFRLEFVRCPTKSSNGTVRYRTPESLILSDAYCTVALQYSSRYLVALESLVVLV